MFEALRKLAIQSGSVLSFAAFLLHRNEQSLKKARPFFAASVSQVFLGLSIDDWHI
jgi:hypothetical protein